MRVKKLRSEKNFLVFSEISFTKKILHNQIRYHTVLLSAPLSVGGVDEGDLSGILINVEEFCAVGETEGEFLQPRVSVAALHHAHHAARFRVFLWLPCLA